MPATLLIVDDDEILGQVLTRVLKRAGYRVIYATSSGQALELAAEHQPRLALLDLCLPDGSGASLGQQLQRKNPELVLILMTAYPVELKDHPEWSRIFIRFLAKPLDVVLVRQAVRDCLAGEARGNDEIREKWPVVAG